MFIKSFVSKLPENSRRVQRALKKVLVKKLSIMLFKVEESTFYKYSA